MTNDSAGAAYGLSVIQDGQEQALKSVHSPWWHYLLFGISLPVLELILALGTPLMLSLVLIGFTVINLLVERGWRRAKGTWVGDFRGGRTRWLSFGFFLITFGAVIAGYFLTRNLGQPWPAWIMAAIILLEMPIYGFLFERSLQRIPVMKTEVGAFNETISPPQRAYICSFLAIADEAEFGTLRAAAGISDLSLSEHLAALADAGYIRTLTPTIVRGRSRMWVALTAKGRKAFTSHRQALQLVLET